MHVFHSIQKAPEWMNDLILSEFNSSTQNAKTKNPLKWTRFSDRDSLDWVMIILCRILKNSTSSILHFLSFWNNSWEKERQECFGSFNRNLYCGLFFSFIFFKDILPCHFLFPLLCQAIQLLWFEFQIFGSRLWLYNTLTLKLPC